jgi:DNA-binding response OmpR family regulator
MEHTKTILVCDNDETTVQQIVSKLKDDDYDVESINDASELIPRALRLKPGVIIVNPDMKAFNAYDVCKQIMKGMNIPIMLLLDPHSTTRAQIDECLAEDVLTKPVKMDMLENLIEKHITVDH